MNIDSFRSDLVLRVPRGAQRHSAWLIVVVAMLTMPLLQRLAPALPGVPAPRVMDVFVPRLPPSQPLSRTASPDPTSAQPPAVAQPIEPAPPLATAVTRVPDIPWLQFAGAAYGLVALVFLLRLAFALIKVGRFMRGARSIGGGVYEQVAGSRGQEFASKAAAA